MEYKRLQNAGAPGEQQGQDSAENRLRLGLWRVGWLLCASCGLQESGTSLVLWAFRICTSIFSVFLNMILCFSWLV